MVRINLKLGGDEVPSRFGNAYVWLLWLIIAILSGILTYNPIYLAILLSITIILSIVLNVNWISSLKTGLLFGTLPLIFNTFFVHLGSHVIVNIPRFIPIYGINIPILFISGNITAEAVLFGFIMMLLLIDMVMVFSIFNSVTIPDSLLNILPSSFGKSSLITAIGMRFTSTIQDDINSIKDAQLSRGLNLNKGNLIQKIKSRISLVNPTVINSLERSFNLAESMASRGYTGKRTKYYTERWLHYDFLNIFILIFILVTLFFLKFSGVLEYWPYTVLELPKLNTLMVISLILLMSPVIGNKNANN